MNGIPSDPLAIRPNHLPRLLRDIDSRIAVFEVLSAGLRRRHHLASTFEADSIRTFAGPLVERAGRLAEWALEAVSILAESGDDDPLLDDVAGAARDLGGAAERLSLQLRRYRDAAVGREGF